MNQLGVEFERMLNENMTRMVGKLDELAGKWSETDGLTLSDETMRKLADFHLNRLFM